MERVKVKIIRKIREKEWILRIKYLRIEERIISTRDALFWKA